MSSDNDDDDDDDDDDDRGNVKSLQLFSQRAVPLIIDIALNTALHTWSKSTSMTPDWGVEFAYNCDVVLK